MDRHEQRERALGEIIKRGLQTLQKGQKIFEPMRGTFSRLDERISQIETVLLSQDEKFNDQQSKLNRAIESIDKWMSTKSSSSGGEPEKLTEVSQQIEDLSVNVKELRKEIDALTTKHDGSAQTTKDSLLNVEQQIVKKLDSAAETIARIQENVNQIGGTKLSTTEGTSWEDTISKELQTIKSNLGQGCSGGSGDASIIDKDFFIGLNNQTLEAIEDIRHEVFVASDKNYLKTSTKLKETATKLDESINEILKNVGESSCDGISTSIADVKKDVGELHKLEQMLAQMGDNVLSVKRGMEFNVHAITLEVTDVIKSSTKQLNSTINDQFDAINQTIFTNHNGAIANLTSKIETEISQVWRQIGIMFNEVSSSKDALEKLQNTTESYVNGTVETMDNMQGKVFENLKICKISKMH